KHGTSPITNRHNLLMSRFWCTCCALRASPAFPRENSSGRATMICSLLHLRPLSEISATNLPACWMALVLIPHAISRPLRSIAGPTDMRTNTTRYGTPIGRKASAHVTLPAAASAALRSQTPMPPQLPTRIRQSIKVIEQCRNCSRASVFTKPKEQRMTRQSVLASLLALVIIVMVMPCAAQQSIAEKEILDLEDRMNTIYAVNDLPNYFKDYGDDFTQWLPDGRTDLPQYKKEWTAFIQGGGRIESNQISEMHVQIDPGGDTAVASYLARVKTRSQNGKVSDETF